MGSPWGFVKQRHGLICLKFHLSCRREDILCNDKHGSRLVDIDKRQLYWASMYSSEVVRRCWILDILKVEPGISTERLDVALEGSQG